MKKAIIAGVVVSAIAMQATRANAESWFNFEAGAGVAKITDIGDGVWQQQGMPGNQLNTVAPVFMAGLTGTAYTHGAWSLDYHLDYVYMGEISASCTCVPDTNYNAQTHKQVGTAAYQSSFNGFGHTQGASLTLSPGYSFGNGWRVGVEGGAWVFWQTWHESQDYQMAQEQDMSHKTVPQVSFVVGARVEKGPFSVAYRYYDMPQRWNPYPGLAKGAQVLVATYRTNLF